jgi:hypothetical protein
VCARVLVGQPAATLCTGTAAACVRVTHSDQPPPPPPPPPPGAWRGARALSRALACVCLHTRHTRQVYDRDEDTWTDVPTKVNSVCGGWARLANGHVGLFAGHYATLDVYQVRAAPRTPVVRGARRRDVFLGCMWTGGVW